jgi:hypothetical protein
MSAIAAFLFAVLHIQNQLDYPLGAEQGISCATGVNDAAAAAVEAGCNDKPIHCHLYRGGAHCAAH